MGHRSPSIGIIFKENENAMRFIVTVYAMWWYDQILSGAIRHRCEIDAEEDIILQYWNDWGGNVFTVRYFRQMCERRCPIVVVVSRERANAVQLDPSNYSRSSDDIHQSDEYDRQRKSGRFSEHLTDYIRECIDIISSVLSVNISLSIPTFGK